MDRKDLERAERESCAYRIDIAQNEDQDAG